MLSEMLSAFREYWYLTLVLIVLVIVAVFAWAVIIKKARITGAKRDAELKRLEEEKKLREEFAVLTKDVVRDSDAQRLIQGIAANVQHELEKESNMNSAFGELPEMKKYIYALNYVFFDEITELSDFFRANGKPLTPAAEEAVCKIIGGEFSENFSRAYRMFDSDDETTSVSDKVIAETNEKFSSLWASEKNTFLEQIKEYVLLNIE